MIKRGDLIKCINNKDVFFEKCYLTVGKIYLALDDVHDGCVTVIDNTGKKFGYYAHRFIVIKKEKIIKEYGIVKFLKEINK